MVTGDSDVVMFAQQFDALARVGSVADNITQAPQFSDAAPIFHIRQHGLECGQVGMNISDYAIAHMPNITAFNGGG